MLFHVVTLSSCCMRLQPHGLMEFLLFQVISTTQPCINDVPGGIITDGNSSQDGLATLPKSSSNASSSLGHPKYYYVEPDNLHSAGCSNSGYATQRAPKAEVADDILYQRHQSGYGNGQSSDRPNSTESSPRREISGSAHTSTYIIDNSKRSDKETKQLKREFLIPSAVKWALSKSCKTSKESQLFREWFKMQRSSLPKSFQDDGNVLFKPLPMWVETFKEWLNQNHKHNERTSKHTNENKLSNQQCSSPRPVVAPSPGENRQYLNRRIVQLLKDRSDFTYRAFLKPQVVSGLIKRYIDAKDADSFLSWMDGKKMEIIKSSARNQRNVLFRPPHVWFKEFRKWKARRSATKSEHGNHPCSSPSEHGRTTPRTDRTLYQRVQEGPSLMSNPHTHVPPPRQ